jgi:hypothetical protein
MDSGISDQALMSVGFALASTPEGKKRQFEEERYTWDFVVVVPNPDHPDYKRGDASMTFQQLIGTFRAGGLQYYAFYSSTSEYVIIKIRASVMRLEMQAEFFGYKMLLDEDKLAIAAAQGIKDTETNSWKVRPIQINGVSGLFLCIYLQPYP